MIPSDILRDVTGLTASQLAHLRKLHLIPRPTRIATIGHGGSSYGYPESVLNRIRLIKLLQSKGVPLSVMAKHVKGTPVECVDRDPSADGKLLRGHSMALDKGGTSPHHRPG